MRLLISSLFCLLLWGQPQSIFCQEWEWIPIAGDHLNIRSGPGVDHGAIGKARIADRVKVLEKTGTIVQFGTKSGEWVKVKRESDGLEGWVYDYYLAYREKCGYYKDFKFIRITVEEGEEVYEYGFRSDELSWYARENLNSEENPAPVFYGRVMKYRNLLLFTDEAEKEIHRMFYFPEGTELTVGKFGATGISAQPLVKLWEKDATYENFKTLFQPTQLPVHIGHPEELKAAIPGIRTGYYIPVQFIPLFPASGRVGFSNAEKFSEYDYSCLHKPTGSFCTFGLKAHNRFDLGHGYTGFIVSSYSWASWAGGVDYHQVFLWVFDESTGTAHNWTMIADNQTGYHGAHPSQSREEVWIGEYGYQPGMNVISHTRIISKDYEGKEESEVKLEYDSEYNLYYFDAQGAHHEQEWSTSSSKFDFELNVELKE